MKKRTAQDKNYLEWVGKTTGFGAVLVSLIAAALTWALLQPEYKSMQLLKDLNLYLWGGAALLWFIAFGSALKAKAYPFLLGALPLTCFFLMEFGYLYVAGAFGLFALLLLSLPDLWKREMNRLPVDIKSKYQNNVSTF